MTKSKQDQKKGKSHGETVSSEALEEIHIQAQTSFDAMFKEYVELGNKLVDLVKLGAQCKNITPVAAPTGGNQKKRKARQQKGWKGKRFHKNITCFKCGEEGHFASKCKKIPNTALVTGDMLCFSCRKPGHVANDCALVKKDQSTKVLVLEPIKFIPALASKVEPESEPTFEEKPRCFTCYSTDHRGEDCPWSKKGKQSGVFAIRKALPSTTDIEENPSVTQAC